MQLASVTRLCRYLCHNRRFLCLPAHPRPCALRPVECANSVPAFSWRRVLQYCEWFARSLGPLPARLSRDAGDRGIAGQRWGRLLCILCSRKLPWAFASARKLGIGSLALDCARLYASPTSALLDQGCVSLQRAGRPTSPAEARMRRGA